MTPTIQTSEKANLRGSMYMTAAMLGYATNDIIIKSFAGQLNLGQTVFIRGLFAACIVGVLVVWFKKIPPLSVALSLPVLFRAIAETVATFMFLTALFNIPIADVSAVMQILPLAVTLGAAYFFGEEIGWRRITAIVVGFLAVLLIIKPGFGGFSIHSLYVVGAVIACVFRDLITRRLATEIPSLFVTLITVLAVCVSFGVWSIAEGWEPVSARQILLTGLSSVFIVMGYFFAVAAMRVGDIGFVSPFRYSILLFSIVGGVIFYGEIPDFYSMLGSAIIVAAGLYTIYREQVTGRQANVTAPTRS
ncbi:MAG: DMT family transporter [Rhizobiaceae bacterium]